MIRTATLQEAADLTAEHLRLCQRLTPNPFLVAVDGKAGAGKTSLASLLSEKLGWPVIHMDDFFLQPHQRTEERLQEPGGNFDRERFLEQVLLPFASQSPSMIQTMDCSVMQLRDKEPLMLGTPLIVEGTYSMHPSLGHWWACSIFLEADLEEQLQRIAARPSHNDAEVFRTRWIPLEQKYFDAFPIRENSDFVFCLKNPA